MCTIINIVSSCIAELQDFSRDMLTRRYISQLQVLPDMVSP